MVVQDGVHDLGTSSVFVCIFDTEYKKVQISHNKLYSAYNTGLGISMQ